MSATQAVLTTFFAEGVPIDCGGIADGWTGCYGKLPAIGVAVVAALAGAGLAAHALVAALLPQVLNTMVGGVPSPDAAGASPAAPTVKVGGSAVPVLPAIGPSVPFDGRVLLVGDGDFSFTAANLGLGRNLPTNVTTTAYSPDGRYSPDTIARGNDLARRGTGVRYNVDARDLPADLAGGAPFDTIVFHFPHPGGPRSQVAAAGQNLMEGFFTSAAPRLAPGGRIAVTLRSQFYVGRWQPVQLAQRAGLRLVSVTEFQQAHYPGYGHVTTQSGAKAPDVSHGFTFVFTRD